MRESTFTLVYWGFIPSFPTKGQLVKAFGSKVKDLSWHNTITERPEVIACCELRGFGQLHLSEMNSVSSKVLSHFQAAQSMGRHQSFVWKFLTFEESVWGLAPRFGESYDGGYLSGMDGISCSQVTFFHIWKMVTFEQLIPWEFQIMTNGLAMFSRNSTSLSTNMIAQLQPQQKIVLNVTFSRHVCSLNSI